MSLTDSSMQFRSLVIALWACIAVATLAPEKKVEVKAQTKATATAPASGAQDATSTKLERMETALSMLAKQPHAPEGIAALLSEIREARDKVRAAKSTESRQAIMQQVSKEVAAFQQKMVLKKQELQEADKKDEVEKAKALAPIASQLQARLAKVESKEKEVLKQQKEREETEAKANAEAKGKKVDKETAKTNKILKYLEKKNSRKVHKKIAQWDQEKKVLTAAIKASKEGKAENVLSSLKKLTHIDKGSQDFLH